DLPAQPESVLEPAALRLFAAVDQSVPVVVDFVLVLALDHERHRLGELKLWAAGDADEPLAVEHEGPGHDIIWRARPGLGVSVDRLDRRVREDRRVELRGFLE